MDGPDIYWEGFALLQDLRASPQHPGENPPFEKKSFYYLNKVHLVAFLKLI